MNLASRVGGFGACFDLSARGRAALGISLGERFTMRGEVGIATELLRGLDPERGSEVSIVIIMGDEKKEGE